MTRPGPGGPGPYREDGLTVSRSRGRTSTAWVVLAALVSLSACEPGSIAEARAELGGRPDTLSLRLPLLVDTIVLADAFTEGDTASTASGAFGLRMDRQSFEFGVAEALAFDDIVFEAFSLGYAGLLQTDGVAREFTISAGLLTPPSPLPVGPARNGPVPAPPFPSDPIRFTTGSGASVIAAEIATGTVVRAIDNNTNCDLTTAVSLRDSAGPVASLPEVTIFAGASLTDSLDLAGLTFRDFVEPDPTVDVTACTGLPTGSLTAGFVFRPLAFASVTLADVDETFSGGYAPLEPRFDALDSLGLASGTLRLGITSRVPLDLTVDLTIDGLTEGGVPVQRSLLVGAAPTDGETVSDLEVDVTNAVLVPTDAFVRVSARAVADTAVLTPAAVAQAADVAGSGAFEVSSLAGVLDPLAFPELEQPLEVEEVVVPDDIDFDDLEDVVRGVSIQDAQLTFLLDSDLGAPFSLEDFQVGLTLTDGAGRALRDGLGAFQLETDSVGQPLLLPLAPPGSDDVFVPADGSLNLTRQAAPLVDRLVDLLLDDQAVALVAFGSVIAGDGTSARVSATDSVSIDLDLVVGFDVVLPDTGLVFDVFEAVEGADLDSVDVREVTERLIEARVLAAVESGFPVELEVDVAIVPRVVSGADEVFGAADRVDIATVVVPAASVDPATGLAVVPAIDTVSASLTGSDVSVLLGDSASVGVRVRVRGDAASGGRARLRSQDRLLLRLSSSVRALLGGR